MMREWRWTLGLWLLSAAAALSAASGGSYPDPERYRDAVDAFVRESPPAGGIVAAGSSSMRGWHRTIEEDLAPLSIVPRGFGGSNMNDLLHFVDELVVRNRPRAVIIYEGDNDISLGVAPATVDERFAAVVARVHAALPETRMYVLSVKPSLARWTIWPQMQETNRLLAMRCAQDERLTYIDVASGMLGEEGTPRREIFVADLLHMNDLGYRIWTAAVRPVLMAGELRHEPSASD